MSTQKKHYDVPYGYRAKAGLIVVGPNLNPTPEISRILPEYIQIRETRVHMDPVVNVAECSKLSDTLAEGARLISEGLCSPVIGNRSVMAFACTAGSLAGGPGWDKKEIEIMEKATAHCDCEHWTPGVGAKQGKSIPSTTTATAAEEAMRFMGMKKICLAGPYIDEISKAFKVFYEASGFQVLNVAGLGIEDLFEMGATRPSDAYKIAMQALVPEADGIFITCTNFRCTDIIEELEQATGKIVITSNQATAWHLMKLLGINDVVEGYGKLLRKTPRFA
ncbi:maleate cis-trans isomerase [Deltaproteobacteria bacterium]|nr:maleate cis-trans isomerase [Deltaproteobacteria bacterium]